MAITAWVIDLAIDQEIDVRTIRLSYQLAVMDSHDCKGEAECVGLGHRRGQQTRQLGRVDILASCSYRPFLCRPDIHERRPYRLEYHRPRTQAG
jgi:hypothetical protein